MMKRNVLLLALAGFLTISLWPVRAQNRPSGQSASHPKSSLEQLSPEEVIHRFTSKESELREVWKDYAYKQETTLQVLGPANTISGEFFQVSEFVFNDAGRRIERILKAPPATLDRTGLSMTAEDRNALINLQPFALAAEDLPNYKLTYISKEKLDELNTYVFDVTPKILSDSRELKRACDQRTEGQYFQGRIWVDDQDLQIVKTAGKTVPEFKQRFPRFETYRENIDGRYWFPTYTYSDDELVFDGDKCKNKREDGGSYHVRMVIKYKDYRQFQSDVKITGASEEVKDEPNKGEETNKVTKPEEKKGAEKKPTPPRPRP